MSKLLDELNKYKDSCLDDNGYVIEGKAEDLVFQSARVIERYEKALIYLSDCTNYMDLDFVLDHVEDVAKEALKEK